MDEMRATSRRGFRRRRAILTLVAATTVAWTTVTVTSVPARALPPAPAPAGPWAAPDPGVFRTADEFVVAATGVHGARIMRAPSANGPWSAPVSPFASRAPWAADSIVWAPDGLYSNGQWVIYFAARPAPNPNFPLDDNARCIGVATAPGADGPFSFESAPLVCPQGHGAHDDMRANPGARNRREGVIDAAPVRVRIDGQARLYLVYKTQGLPATIRLVRLSDDGTDIGTRPGGTYRRSNQLIASRARNFDDTIQAPTIVQRGGRFILFTANGLYTRCAYSTGWYRSYDIWKWAGARWHVLLSQENTGVCGPGAADVTQPQLVRGTGAVRSWMFLSGWVCDDDLNPCARNGQRLQDDGLRVLYVAVIDWDGTTPRLQGFVQPANRS